MVKPALCRGADCGRHRAGGDWWRDPDPRVSGKGIAMLKAAGMEVDELLLPEAALNAGFFHRVTHGMPYVSMKLATSSDFFWRVTMAAGNGSPANSRASMATAFARHMMRF